MRAAVLLAGCLIPAALAADSAADRLAWFREAKFGMFIHWGPYSMAAGEWEGREVPPGKNAEWIMHDLRIPVARYREMAHGFNPVKFDAALWARLARQAGMRYLVITAKHHDGFAMYHSRVSGYNIVDWTPFKRDPLAELAEACRREGIRFCFYYSHREDWDDPDAYGNDWDYTPAKQDFAAYLERKSKPQLRELLTGYGPIGLVWFDRGLYTPAQARDFMEIVRTLQPGCLVNGRVGNYDQELEGDYQSLSDNGMPPGGLDEYWETPQTLNDTWGYSRFDHHWKTPETVVRRLVEIASKGGNYLLNIGPMGDGAVPQPTVEILGRVGAWVARYGESVYGTAAAPFGALPWGRVTVKGARLYLHVFAWPPDGMLRLNGLRNTPRAARLLGAAPGKLSYEKRGSTLLMRLPAAAPDPIDSVVAVDLDAPPRVDPPVVEQHGSAPLKLDYMTAVTSGTALKRFNRKGGFHISKWTGPADAATWQARIAAPGRYAVRLRYAARPAWEGGRYEIAVGPRVLRGTVQGTPGWYEYRTVDAGTVDLAAGAYTVKVRPAASTGHDLMYFESLELRQDLGN